MLHKWETILAGSAEGNGSWKTVVDVQLVLKLMFSSKDGRLWNGFIWLRIRARDGLT